VAEVLNSPCLLFVLFVLFVCFVCFVCLFVFDTEPTQRVRLPSTLEWFAPPSGVNQLLMKYGLRKQVVDESIPTVFVQCIPLVEQTNEN
jgi:hypothetical protein